MRLMSALSLCFLLIVESSGIEPVDFYRKNEKKERRGPHC
jgi:hypothetical protein